MSFLEVSFDCFTVGALEFSSSLALIGAIAFPLVGLAFDLGSFYLRIFLRLVNARSPPKILTNESANRL